MLRCLVPSKGDCVKSRSLRDIQQVPLTTAQRSFCHGCQYTSLSPSGVRLSLTSSQQHAYQNIRDPSLVFDFSVIKRNMIFLNGLNSLSMIRAIDAFPFYMSFSTR